MKVLLFYVCVCAFEFLFGLAIWFTSDPDVTLEQFRDEVQKQRNLGILMVAFSPIWPVVFLIMLGRSWKAAWRIWRG